MRNLVWVIVAAISCLFSDVVFAQVHKEVPNDSIQVTYSYAPVVKKTSPAVVNIYTKRKVKERGYAPLLNDPYLREFFGQQLFAPYVKEKIERSLGSGVIIRSDGLIVTSNHVIKDSQEITVVLSDRREFDAQVVLTDQRADLALLKINPKDGYLTMIDFADSDALEVGDIVLAIGNPFGVGQTVTNGIVSALSRSNVGITDYQFFIQTDAPINPGNSGGALVTMDGKLAGVNTAIFSRSGGSHGIGFAIPSNMVKSFVRNYEQGGKLSRPWLGAAFKDITGDMAKTLKLKAPAGALVSDVYLGSPAQKAGLMKGDVIIAIDGFDVSDYYSLNYRIATAQTEQTVSLSVLRNGVPMVLKAKLEAPQEMPPADKRLLKGNQPLTGITVANLSPKIALDFGLDPFRKGVVVVGFEENNRRVALNAGDIIERINNVKITSSNQMAEIVAQGARYWKIDLERGGKLLTMTIR